MSASFASVGKLCDGDQLLGILPTDTLSTMKKSMSWCAALLPLCQTAAWADAGIPLDYDPAPLPIGLAMFVGGLGMIGLYIAKRNAAGFAKFKKPLLVFGLLSFLLSFVTPIFGLRIAERRRPSIMEQMGAADRGKREDERKAQEAQAAPEGALPAKPPESPN